MISSSSSGTNTQNTKNSDTLVKVIDNIILESAPQSESGSGNANTGNILKITSIFESSGKLNIAKYLLGLSVEMTSIEKDILRSQDYGKEKISILKEVLRGKSIGKYVKLILLDRYIMAYRSLLSKQKENTPEKTSYIESYKSLLALRRDFIITEF